MLRGKSVLLPPVRRSDLANFLACLNDPEVIQYVGMHLPMTEMAEEKWIEELGTTRARTDVVFVIEVLEGEAGMPIGTTGLHSIHPQDHVATFGIAIGEKKYWSKGYGTEATRLLITYGFEQLNLPRISSFAVSFNERSIRMHKRVGFKEEGRQREAVFKNGKFHDHVVFGLLREEWRRDHGIPPD